MRHILTYMKNVQEYRLNITHKLDTNRDRQWINAEIQSNIFKIAEHSNYIYCEQN